MSTRDASFWDEASRLRRGAGTQVTPRAPLRLCLGGSGAEKTVKSDPQVPHKHLRAGQAQGETQRPVSLNGCRREMGAYVFLSLKVLIFFQIMFFSERKDKNEWRCQGGACVKRDRKHISPLPTFWKFIMYL